MHCLTLLFAFEKSTKWERMLYTKDLTLGDVILSVEFRKEMVQQYIVLNWGAS